MNAFAGIVFFGASCRAAGARFARAVPVERARPSDCNVTLVPCSRNVFRCVTRNLWIAAVASQRQGVVRRVARIDNRDEVTAAD